MPLLEAKLGAGRVLALTGDWGLYVLNSSASMLWELHAQGWDVKGMASLLSEGFGLDGDTALAQVESLINQWHQTGLIEPCCSLDEACSEQSRRARRNPGFVARYPDSSGGSIRATSAADEPCAVRADVHKVPKNRTLAEPHPAHFTLALAGMSLSLIIDDTGLAQCAVPLVQSLRVRDEGRIAHRLHLAGGIEDWTLWQDDRVEAEGQGSDDALVMTMRTLVEIGCHQTERLMIIHGAGLALDDGRGLLLIAPGGSGKTTLAAALNAAGYGLLSDDVVPVTPGGELVGLGMPLCLKAGSWPILSSIRPDLEEAAIVWRYDEPVRYVPPRGQPLTGSLRPGLLLCPRDRPGSTVAVFTQPLDYAVLRIIEALGKNSQYKPPYQRFSSTRFIRRVRLPPFYLT